MACGTLRWPVLEGLIEDGACNGLERAELEWHAGLVHAAGCHALDKLRVPGGVAVVVDQDAVDAPKYK